MSLEELQQNYTDATGLVIDRISDPPKVLGEAFLVTKSRAVTCASVVYNYVEAPFALQVHFPHPDILVGVKSIALHNDFDKRAARAWYLAQTGAPGEQLLLPNDIATMVLDGQLPELQSDKVAELNRALTIPFSSENVQASGNITGADFFPMLNGVLQTRRNGLLTLFDARNIPIARIELADGNIQRVYYRGLLGELAFFELVYRKPYKGYSFQEKSNFSWGNLPTIIAPAGALIDEAQRRAQEMPQVLAFLGGPQARYQKRVESSSEATVSENFQWLIDRLWDAIDGYMTVDVMSERVGADSYTVAQALRELINRAVISMINKTTPFRCNGVLGQPLTSHTDFEVHAWDALQAFYLDPLSGRPIWQQGNFFGVANALQPKNMLHTIPLPPYVPGALICKDYKLIGIHSGPHTPKPGQPVPPVKLYQMMWMGALLDMSTKKLRDQDVTGGFNRLRTTQEQPVVVPELLETFVCSKCHSTNTKLGPCFNCGAIVEAPSPEEQTKSKIGNPITRLIVSLKERYLLTNRQMILYGALVLLVPLTFLVLFSPPPPEAPPETSPEAPVDKHLGTAETIRMATEYAGFSGTAIPGYWYKDTYYATKPTKSFALISEQGNNRVMFLIMDDMSALDNLGSFINKPPFLNDLMANVGNNEYQTRQSMLGTAKLTLSVGSYRRVDDPNKHETVVVGSFASPQKGKSILVESRCVDPERPYDPRATEFLIDQMEVALKQNANNATTGDNSVVAGSTSGGEKKEASTTEAGAEAKKEQREATDEELDKYCEVLAKSIQAKLKLSDEAEEARKGEHFKKLKCAMTVGIDQDGNVKKLEISKSAEMDAATAALQKAINTAAPFEDVPKTKNNMLEILVKYNGKEIKVERP